MALVSTQPLKEMSNRNIAWWVKAAGAKADNLTVSVVRKSGSIKLLEDSGPVQDCTGIALPYLYVFQ